MMIDALENYMPSVLASLVVDYYSFESLCDDCQMNVQFGSARGTTIYKINIDIKNEIFNLLSTKDIHHLQKQKIQSLPQSPNNKYFVVFNSYLSLFN
jgi:hypothetical protein